MTLKTSSRGSIPPFLALDILRQANARAAAGDSVLHLEVGEPATAAPEAVRRAAIAAIEAGRVGYTDAGGLPSLRRRIARSYLERYGEEVDPARVMVTTGSSGGFLLAFLAAFDVGDRVALAAPGYPAYRYILSAVGLEPVLLPVTAADRYQPTPALLDSLERPVDGLIVASPSNPTGTMLDRQHLAALLNYCRARGIRVVSDEIYHGITFGPSPTTVLSLGDEAIVVNSFSKYFSMTGWRIGWLVLPEALVRSVECLIQSLFISAPLVSQVAGEAAFDCKAELDAYVAAYARKRNLLVERLPKAGFTRLAPADGAFYLYADVGDLTNDSQNFCARMLEEIGVAMTPGVDFDPERGHRFVRISFAGAESEIASACDRLERWIKGLRGNGRA
ncbi:MAG: pyridoxal phosphate-dependent aminotransferase [Kiloniellales bacterium]